LRVIQEPVSELGLEMLYWQIEYLVEKKE